MLPFICEESAEGHTDAGHSPASVSMDTLAPSALRYDAGLSLVDTLVAARLRCDEGSRTEAV